MQSQLSLADWEEDLRKRLSPVASDDRRKAGALLATIPDREAWSRFVSDIRTAWAVGREAVLNSQHCLVVLYGGLAFYKYASNSFWPQFAETVGAPVGPREQSLINHSFARGCSALGLKLLKRSVGDDFVGSAVFHIGIPLSVWDEFLDLCTWALAENNWANLPDHEWVDAITRHTSSQTRLRRFLTENRGTARFAIQEMLEAREIQSPTQPWRLET